MSYLLSILFFITVFPLLGWSFLRLIRFDLDKPFLESYFLYLGVGLGFFPFLTIILNLLSIPLAWWVFLIPALVVPVLNFRRFTINPSFVFNGFKDIHFLLMLVIFAVLFGIILNGAFVYPYLEDDDSWAHALSAKYVAVEKNLKLEPNILAYLNPYPPGYAALMGVLHQLNDSVYWTLKFFNALIVALTIPFFYLFANLLLNSKTKALFSAFVLASLPSFLSHFIWAPSLAMLLIIITLYWMVYFAREKLLAYQSSLLAVLVAGIFLTQVTHAIKFGILFLAFFIISAIVRKRFNASLFLSGIFGIILSLFWWGSKAFDVLATTQTSAVAKGKGFILANNIGTGSRAYTLSEFLFPPHQGLMTNPVGIGWVVSLLALIGVVAIVLVLFLRWKTLGLNYKEASIFVLFAAIFTFFGVNSVTFNLPVGLFAFRFWMFLAIPAALLSAYGLWSFSWFLKRVRLAKLLPFFVLLILAGVTFSSAYPKYSINTSFWSPGMLWSYNNSFFLEEIQGFSELRDMPKTKIFPMCREGFKKIIGNDQLSCAWCMDELEFQKQIIDKSPADISSFLKNRNYQWLVPEVSCLNTYSGEQLNAKINALLSSGMFGFNPTIKNLIILEVV